MAWKRNLNRDAGATVNDPLREIVFVAERLDHCAPRMDVRAENPIEPTREEYAQFTRRLLVELMKVKYLAMEALLERDEKEMGG